MKYQYYVLGKYVSDHPAGYDWRAFYVPVEVRDGRRVVCGKAIELTSRVDQAQCASDVYEFETADPETPFVTDRASGIEVPEGWKLMADFALPDNYVPESKEVFEERGLRARRFFKEMGLFND